MHVSCHMFAMLLACDAKKTGLVTGDVAVCQHHAKHKAHRCYSSVSVALCAFNPAHIAFNISHWRRSGHGAF